mmetsp:Transcript_27487/g.79671  ORF Transcript_27487/g.79671 Transcript_27487/m.79671 type:complete len:485 (+) Transcript_27487:592-2046(+)
MAMPRPPPAESRRRRRRSPRWTKPRRPPRAGFGNQHRGGCQHRCPPPRRHCPQWTRWWRPPGARLASRHCHHSRRRCPRPRRRCPRRTRLRRPRASRFGRRACHRSRRLLHRRCRRWMRLRRLPGVASGNRGCRNRRRMRRRTWRTPRHGAPAESLSGRTSRWVWTWTLRTTHMNASSPSHCGGRALSLGPASGSPSRGRIRPKANGPRLRTRLRRTCGTSRPPCTSTAASRSPAPRPCQRSLLRLPGKVTRWSGGMTRRGGSPAGPRPPAVSRQGWATTTAAGPGRSCRIGEGAGRCARPARLPPAAVQPPSRAMAPCRSRRASRTGRWRSPRLYAGRGVQGPASARQDCPAPTMMGTGRCTCPAHPQPTAPQPPSLAKAPFSGSKASRRGRWRSTRPCANPAGPRPTAAQPVRSSSICRCGSRVPRNPSRSVRRPASSLPLGAHTLRRRMSAASHRKRSPMGVRAIGLRPLCCPLTGIARRH